MAIEEIFTQRVENYFDYAYHFKESKSLQSICKELGIKVYKINAQGNSVRKCRTELLDELNNVS